jgi:hypothetical protein
LIDLSVRVGALLVVLASRQTNVDQVADRVARTPGARALVVNVRADQCITELPSWTSAPEFAVASGGRTSDLSIKRNLGLLLARLNGWRKVVFLDDDITRSRAESFTRLAWQLDRTQIAGMICRDFPDNSVVCHARRLAGLPQDNFVSGAVLGVRCDDLPLPFFPDIYNEDWFAFSPAVVRRELANVGDATQTEYEPFASPTRARHEEFGDLLAEGLYTLIGDSDPTIPFRQLLRHATTTFWETFIQVRQHTLAETAGYLDHLGAHIGGDELVDQALGSLHAADAQLSQITAVLCGEFLTAWQDDIADWDDLCKRTSTVGSIRDAMDIVGAADWRIAQFGDADVSSAHLPALTRN